MTILNALLAILVTMLLTTITTAVGPYDLVIHMRLEKEHDLLVTGSNRLLILITLWNSHW